jgi:hypothetical protein
MPTNGDHSGPGFFARLAKGISSLFNEEPYGLELAERVAQLLDSGGQIADCHAYYCGTGFVRDGGQYCWSHIDDGYPGQVLMGFASRAAFVEWLAAQTDATLERWPGDGKVQIPGRLRMKRDVALP